MNESERPSRRSTPEHVWKSIEGKDEASMDMTFTPDQLFAMARSRERENIWSRRLLLLLLSGLAGAFAYNAFSVANLSLRLSQSWMLAWTCLLLWRIRRGRPPMNATDHCASFLQREFEEKRRGLLEIRRYMLLLIPPILASWLAGGGRMLRLIRLKELG